MKIKRDEVNTKLTDLKIKHTFDYNAQHGRYTIKMHFQFNASKEWPTLRKRHTTFPSLFISTKVNERNFKLFALILKCKYQKLDHGK